MGKFREVGVLTCENLTSGASSRKMMSIADGAGENYSPNPLLVTECSDKVHLS
jgi:hypothetical protein